MSCFLFSARTKASLSSCDPRPTAGEGAALGTPHCFGGALVFRKGAEVTEGLRRRAETVGFALTGDGVSSSEAIPCMADHESPKKADNVAGDCARSGRSPFMLLAARRVCEEAVRGRWVLGMGDGSRDSKGEGSGEAWRTLDASVGGASSSRPEIRRGARGRRVDDWAVVELVRELMANRHVALLQDAKSPLACPIQRLRVSSLEISSTSALSALVGLEDASGD